MTSHASVRIFSTPTCPYCQRAKEYFAEHDIPFIDINVAEDEEAQKEMLDLSGQMGVPVIEANGQIIIGFDQKRLGEVLGVK